MNALVGTSRVISVAKSRRLPRKLAVILLLTELGCNSLGQLQDSSIAHVRERLVAFVENDSVSVRRYHGVEIEFTPDSKGYVFHISNVRTPDAIADYVIMYWFFLGYHRDLRERLAKNGDAVLALVEKHSTKACQEKKGPALAACVLKGEGLTLGVSAFDVVYDEGARVLVPVDLDASLANLARRQ